MTRYTSKNSARSLWQAWMTVDPKDANLNDHGRILAAVARQGFKRFETVISASVSMIEKARS